MRLGGALALAAIALAAATGHADPAPAAPQWEAVVTLADLAPAQADVVWTARGFSGPIGVCIDMDGAGKYVHDLRDGKGALAHDPDDADCFLAQAPAGAPLVLRYRYDLGGLASDEEDVDLAMHAGDDLIFDDRAILLRPDPMPDRATIELELHLPKDVAIAAPWERVPGAALRYRYTPSQHDSGAYVALGKLSSLGEIPVADGVVALSVFDRPFKAARATLVAWVKNAMRMVAEFVHQLPGKRVNVILCPVRRSDDSGVFGTVLRGITPSVVLFFGAGATDEKFADEWVSAHELFHLSNPMVHHRFPWFSEGFTTYYEHVIRARRNPATSDARWGDLVSGIAKHCDPEHQRPLSQESRELGQRHNFPRVYWGGACVAFRLDVAIRIANGGKRSLDDAMRDLRTRSQSARLEEDEVVAALDKEAGRPLLHDFLAARKPIQPSIFDLLRSLGVEPVSSEKVRFRDEAPLSWVRRGMF
jgi:hypothetical protein